MAYHEATGRKRDKREGKLHHLEVHKAENGGHLVHHVHEDASGGIGFNAPRIHAFGEDEGQKMLDHIAEHMDVKKGDEDNDSEAAREEGEEEE